MLPRQHRLAKDRDIKRVFAQGRSFFNPFFTLKYLKLAAQTRFAFVVSAKVSKKAVKRNRLKRVLREQVRKNLESLAPGDYVLVLKPQGAQNPEVKLLESFQNVLIKAALFRHP